jgi:hypothetical protein
MTKTIYISDVFALIPGFSPHILRASDCRSFQPFNVHWSSPQFISRVEELTCSSPSLTFSFNDQARKLGLARAGSVPMAGCLAAILCHEGIGLDTKAYRTGLFVCSTSAASSTTYKFEKFGMAQGWKIVDPFWLPNALPTAVATSVFAMLKLKGVTCGFQGGVHGVFSALDYALMVLAEGEVDQALVLLTEERAEYHEILVGQYGFEDKFPNATVGILLASRDCDRHEAWPKLHEVKQGYCDSTRTKSDAEVHYSSERSQNTKHILSQYNIAHSFLPLLMLFGIRANCTETDVCARIEYSIAETCEWFMVSVDASKNT